MKLDLLTNAVVHNTILELDASQPKIKFLQINYLDAQHKRTDVDELKICNCFGKRGKE
jgi:hypothetical protein